MFLKQIFKRPQVHSFTLLKTYKNHSTAFLSTEKFLFKPNLKILSNEIRTHQLYTSQKLEAKLYVETENAYAFNVLEKISPKEKPNASIVTVTKNIMELEDFISVLDQNWRKSTATDIVAAFKNLRQYCIDNNIMISDKRFDKLTDGLMDNCEKLTDNELLELLLCLIEYPPCDSYSSHNFHDIWSCLDDICCWKMYQWDTDTMFLFANIWYKLNLGKLCDYIFEVLDRNTRKADRFTKDQLVHIFFYHNITRKQEIDFHYEYALANVINSLNVEEMAVVALGYFKTKTKIKLAPIMEAMIKEVTNNTKNIHEITLTAIIKILRYSKPTKSIDEINVMLDHLCEEIYRLNELSCLHLALISTGLQTYHKKTLQKTTEKLVKNITDPERVRLKDIERLLNVLSMFDFDPKTDPDVFKTAYDELHKEHRLAELIKYPRCLPCALNYLSLRNMYSYELMNKVLDLDFIQLTYGKGAKAVPRELLSLDASINIECPDYEGNRLPPNLKYKVVKWQTDFTPSYDQYKKLTALDKLILETIDTVKLIVKDEKFIYINHVLPHFPKADIILCKDNTGKFIEPQGFQKYLLGDVMFPYNDGTLTWIAIMVLGWNHTIRDSSLPLGYILMKERQLRKIGYHPVMVIWNEFLKLSSEEKVQYVSKKLM